MGAAAISGRWSVISWGAMRDWGLHGDGFLEFQGGADELLHLTAEVRQFPGDFAVAALEGLQPVEFGLELVDLLYGQVG